MLERFFDFVLGQEIDDLLAQGAGVGVEEFEAAVALDDDGEAKDQEGEDGDHEEPAFEEFA